VNNNRLISSWILSAILFADFLHGQRLIGGWNRLARQAIGFFRGQGEMPSGVGENRRAGFDRVEAEGQVAECFARQSLMFGSRTPVNRVKTPCA
jgi:hypothetical protein